MRRLAWRLSAGLYLLFDWLGDAAQHGPRCECGACADRMAARALWRGR